MKAISLLEIAARGLADSPENRIHHVHSMAPSRIAVPDLVVGARFLNAWAFNGQPSQIDWRETFYNSMAPATFVLRDVVVHASAGLIQIDDNVLYESLFHTVPDEHGYDVSDGQVFVRPRTVTDQPGTHISILAGGKTNYFHAMIEGAARICMLRPDLIEQAQSLLVTQGAVAQTFALDRLGLPRRLTRRQMADSDSLRIERLIYPWSVNGDCDYHPCVNIFFDKIAGRVSPGKARLPRRFYIDRRGTPLRPLLNEDELIEHLRPLGFVPVKPETLSAADQVRLFRGAEAIVAPHGAGLTNIGYCRPGVVVLELLMDAYVNWCFRRLAAVRGVRYDCVLGRCVDPWSVATRDPHGLTWKIAANQVVSAAEFLLSPTAVEA